MYRIVELQKLKNLDENIFKLTQDFSYLLKQNNNVRSYYCDGDNKNQTWRKWYNREPLGFVHVWVTGSVYAKQRETAIFGKETSKEMDAIGQLKALGLAPQQIDGPFQAKYIRQQQTKEPLEQCEAKPLS